MKRLSVLVVIAILGVGMLLPLSSVANGSFPPVIGSIPDIFIGNEEDNVGQTVDIGWFRFPNALNLDEYVCDIDTVTSQICWSFYEDPAGADGAIDNFDINDKTQLGDPANAILPGAKEITGCADPPTRNPIITLWDIKACPQKDSVTSYNVAMQELSQDILVTFYASDGTAAASQTIIITSLRGAFDSLSTPPPWGYSYPFDDPDAEGWEPYPIPAGTLITTPYESYYIAPTTATMSMIGIVDKTDSNLFGAWQMKYETSMDYAPNFLYKARYTLKTDQPDVNKVPLSRLRWSDFASLVMSSLRVGSGPNAPTPVWDNYNSYYYQPTTEGAVCRNLKLYLDLIDFSAEQQGNIYCDAIEVSRFTPPTGGTPVVTYDTPADFAKWRTFCPDIFDSATSGVTASGGLWLESPGPVGPKGLTFGGWGTDPDQPAPYFEDGNLYCAIFTLRCESDEAKKHLPKMRVRISNGAFDWNATRDVRQVDGCYGQLPTPAGREYPLFIETPPHLTGDRVYPKDSIVLNFDIVDAIPGEYGRVYLDKVEVVSFPLP